MEIWTDFFCGEVTNDLEAPKKSRIQNTDCSSAWSPRKLHKSKYEYDRTYIYIHIYIYYRYILFFCFISLSLILRMYTHIYAIREIERERVSEGGSW